MFYISGGGTGRTSTDPIVHLDADTFTDTVLRPNRDKAYLVEFYKDWCGYCRRFAPFFKVLSESIKSWPFVQVAAINCADAYNVKICKANDIPTVPKLKYFPRSARSFEDGQVVEHSYDSAMEMRGTVHQMITNEFKAEMDKGNTDFYLNHMAYEQNGENNQREPWTDVSNSTQFLVQLFEQNIKEGLPFSLALLLFKPHVEARRVLVTSGNDPRIVRPQEGGAVKLPYVTVMERGKTEPILAESLNERTLPRLHELLKPMMEELNKTEQAEAHHKEPEHVVDCSQQPEKCKQMFFVGETDMLKAIHAALLDEVISSGGDEIGRERFPALRQFVELLIQRFPRKTFERNLQIDAHPKGVALSSIGRPLLRSQRALKVFEHMKQFLDSKANEGQVSMDEWKAEFEQSKTQNGDPFPVTAEWEHCKGSQTIFRGFTCGLWTAFHAMTVQAYLGKEQNPLKPLKAIQGWVANFFSCSGCRRHFMDMTTKTFPMEASNVKKPEDVVLYLWKAHNIVNKRLNGDEATEDPQFTKEQFPPTYLCPECQKSATGNGKDVELDPEKTLQFLLNYSTNIKAPEAALAEVGKQPKGNNPLLYSVNDPIVHLDADTFTDTVLRPNRDKAYLVEFYKDWCGYCRHFAPFFKVLSKSIKSWPFVQVAAINCADAYNVKICKANDISTVPQLKYFPRSARSYEDGQVVEHSYDSAMEMRGTVHQMITNEFKAEIDKGNTDFYLNHMAYEQNGENNQREPWTDVSNSTQFLVQLFEQNIKEGLPFSLALLLFKPHVEARRVLVTSGNDPRIVRPQNASAVKLPYVTVMERGKTEPILAESLNERTLPRLHELLKPMMEELNKTEQAEAHHTEPVHVVDCSQQPEKCKEMFFVGETDMLKAIHTALLDEVISSGGDEIDKQKFPALRQFVELLIQRFPTFERNPQIDAHPKGVALSSIGKPLLRSQRALKVFEHMKQFLDSKANEGQVSMDEWKAEFEQSKTQNGDPFPVTAEWEHCKGSRTIFRGFTCGLWTAFHAMTVQAYLGKEQNPLKPLKAIQGWVANFFSCSGCRRHFMDMTTKTFPMEASNVKKPEDVVLYLWKAHNIVNKRLYDDKQTEDPQFPKEQFPPTYLCPECQKSATGNGKEVELDPEKTLQFLLNYSTNIKARP
ncbi:hypothetical protein GPALN_010814 [Globodera pallida]|nr:hypothetical protein GPALN_010814 [Globodera pallida]